MKQKTFLIVDDFWAWIPHNVEGKPHKDRYGKIWINELDEDKITVTDPRGETSLKKREDDDKPRKFVTFTKIKEQEKYEFIGIFQYVSRKGNKFIYERTYKEMNPPRGRDRGVSNQPKSVSCCTNIRLYSGSFP